MTELNDHFLKGRIMQHIIDIYPDMPPTFYGWELYNKVRDRIAQTEHKWVYPDSILRYLRQLREDGTLNYDVIRKTSKYTKL